jgi:hypothetical protein
MIPKELQAFRTRSGSKSAQRRATTGDERPRRQDSRDNVFNSGARSAIVGLVGRAPETRSPGAERPARTVAAFPGQSPTIRTSLRLVGRAAPFKEEMIPGLKRKGESPACRCIGLAAGGLAVCLTAAALAAGKARAESANAIPQFASVNFGWQSNLEDWEDPPPGAGHGPIKNDPAYPFLNNTEGNRARPRAQAVGGSADSGDQ